MSKKGLDLGRERGKGTREVFKSVERKLDRNIWDRYEGESFVVNVKNGENIIRHKLGFRPVDSLITFFETDNGTMAAAFNYGKFSNTEYVIDVTLSNPNSNAYVRVIIGRVSEQEGVAKRRRRRL